jgi:predicted transposase YdaD
MVIAGIPREDIRHTRAVQDWLAEGRQEGLQAGLQEGKALEAAKMTLRLLNRRCGPLSDATSAQIQALPVDKLEALAVGAAFSAGVALLDFQGLSDLAAWLAANS